MEVRTCKRCRQHFAWDSGPIDWINSCPRCSGRSKPPDELAEWVVRGCVVIGAVIAAWVLVGAVKWLLM